MEFSDKLNFLMNITQVSNKELAYEISVDRSLISLLRNGKRKTPRNHDMIKNTALFFAKRCTADFQRHAIAEMTGQVSLRSSMPTELLADRLYQWLLGDPDVVDQMIAGMKTVPPKASQKSPCEISAPSAPSTETLFFYGEEGRRDAIRHTMNLIRSTDAPSSLLIASDDNWDWVYEDYAFSSELQQRLLEILDRNFTIHQILPSMNHLNNSVEGLRYWLPLYVTEHAKAYYYPRLRDNLYKHSFLILPGHCVQTVTGIGADCHHPVSMVSTDLKVVQAYTEQYKSYLSLCKPALIAHTAPEEFASCFQDMFSKRGFSIQKVDPLSPATIPKEVLELYIGKEKNTGWEIAFQMYLNGIPKFEERLKNGPFIDMSRLATADEVRAGSVYIAAPFKVEDSQPHYTPETYILHLRNILRLMDRYENYYFLPYHEESQKDYSLIVNEDDLALLLRTSFPPLMLEIQRPEIVRGCKEHLLRLAEKEGYRGIHRSKIRAQINALIRELQN